MNKILNLILTMLFLPIWTWAGFTVQGRLLQADGTPLLATGVQFRIQVKTSGSESCLLYQEAQTLDLQSSRGSFSITVGDGTRVGAGVDGGLPLSTVFSNTQSMTTVAAGCADASTSYTPSLAAIRVLKLSYNDGTGWDDIPTIPLNPVPQSMYAYDTAKLGGINAALYLLRGDIPVCGTTEFLTRTASGFVCQSLDLGSSANQIPQLDGSGKLSVSVLPTTIVSAATDVASATAANTASTLVKRDASGAITVTSVQATTLQSTNNSVNNIYLYNAGNTNYVKLMAPAALTNYTLTFPNDVGVSGTVLTTDSLGRLSWTSVTTSVVSSTVINALGYTPVNKAGDTMSGSLNVTGDVEIGSSTTNNALVKIWSVDSGSTNSGVLLVDKVAQYGSWQNPAGLDGVSVDTNGAPNGWSQLFLNYYSSGDTIISKGGGKVGIGIEAPGYQLDVSGTVQISKTILVGTGSSSIAGKLGIGLTTPTAKLHIAQGSAAANSAPLKLTSGTVMTAPEAGAIEYDGANLYFTDGTATRRTLAATNSSSSSSFSNVSQISNPSGGISLTPSSGNSVLINQTTTSTGPAFGALVVNGGLGVAENINAGGNINALSGTISGASFTATNGIISPNIYGSTSVSGSLYLDSTTNSTKGKIILAQSGGFVGIGTATPAVSLTNSSSTMNDALNSSVNTSGFVWSGAGAGYAAGVYN